MADDFGLTDEFDGEIIASGGVRILAGTGSSPPNQRKVRWVNDPNTGVQVAEIQAYDDGTNDFLGLFANPNGTAGRDGTARMAGISPSSTHIAIVETQGLSTGSRVNVYADGVVRRVLDSGDQSNFAQRFRAGAVSLSNSRFNLGTSTVTWPGGSALSNNLDITHGLGISATHVFLVGATIRSDIGLYYMALVNPAISATQFRVAGVNPTGAAVGAGVTGAFTWLAFAS